MEASLAELLRGLRAARALSLSQLSARAKVSERTLSYWEAGTHQPRVPELESVLAALGAAAEQRAQALALCAPSYGTQQLRLSPEHIRLEADLGTLPSGGDLLRAMRHRRGLHLEQVAAQMGVSAATVSRWENSKVMPPPERLDALLDCLGAREGEHATLKEGYLFLLAPLRETALTVSALQQSFDAFMYSHYITPDYRLDDLRFLSFEAQAWPLAVRKSAGRHLLASVCANYSAFLAASGRIQEAGRYAYRALDLQADTATEASRIRGAIITARAEVFRGTQAAPERGLQILQSWRSSALPPAFHAWLLADMSEYLALESDWEAARRLGQEACRIAERDPNSEEARFRRIDLARVEMDAGNAERALSLVTLSARDPPSRRTGIELLFAEGLLALGERGNAQTWLERADADILAFDLAYLRSRAVSLKTRL